MANLDEISIRAEKLHLRMQYLGCPFLRIAAGGDSLVALLCSPGELHMQLLQWAFSRFSLQFQISDDLTATALSPDSNHTCAKQLLKFGTVMGLCEKEDLDLMTGRASPTKQLNLLEKLLDQIDIMEELKRSSRDGTSGLRAMHALTMCDFLAELRNRRITAAVHPDSCAWRLLGLGQPPRSSLLSLPKNMKKQSEQMEEKNDLLQELEELRQKERATIPDGTTNSKPADLQKLCKALSDITQLQEDFVCTYKRELWPACRPALPSSPHPYLGPLFGKINDAVSSINMDYGNLQHLVESCQGVQSMQCNMQTQTCDMNPRK
uniref:HAUS augmin-like complex subunit 7 n=1 Tax=Myxine glutinosa TaxID=7769 RepID=UPI00358EA16C